MIKRALLRTVASKWVEEQGYKTPQELFDNLEKLYKYLQTTENFGNLVEGIPFGDFIQAAQLGFQLATMQSHFSYGG